MNHDEARALDAEFRQFALGGNLAPEYRGWLEAAIAYANMRARWGLIPVAERQQHDARRTGLHNVAIDALNRLSRDARKAGLSNDWRGAIGDDRRRIGDFACWCALFRGIESR